MSEYWVKLYIKSLDNEVFQYDYTAWHVFEFCLMRSYPSGSFRTSRAEMAEYLHINPNTLYSALRRLEKHEMVNIASNNRFSTISICKWGEYQGPVNSPVNSASTTRQQRVNNQSGLDGSQNKNKNKNNTPLPPLGEAGEEKSLEVVEEGGLPTPWGEAWYRAMGFKITKRPKENEAAIRNTIRDNSEGDLKAALAYLHWMKTTKKTRERPHWFQYVTSFIKVRQFWDHIQAGIADDGYQEGKQQEQYGDFFNR